MSIRNFLNKLSGKAPEKADLSDNQKDAITNIKNWYTDRYESAIIQRNLLVLLMIVSLVTIIFSVITIRYLKSSKSIEPFVIEIEPKTGVPTVVDPVTVQAYSADEAIKRYFVLKYLKAREEYIPSLYQYNYATVVRLLSTSDVYYADYRPKFSTSNPTSPVNLYAQSSYRNVHLKSIIFTSDDTAQVRFYTQVDPVTGSQLDSQKTDKVAFIQFKFDNLNMNDEERLINPLGFRVTLYRLEDERAQ